MTTPDEMRAMAERLEINPRGVTLTQYHALMLSIKNNQAAAAMLSSIAAEREAEQVHRATHVMDSIEAGR